MVRELRANLIDEKECLYIMHTPLGAISVAKWDYGIAGFVTVTGEDEQGKAKFVVFLDEEACSFPLEVRHKKSGASKTTVGFKTTANAHTEEKS
jgi:hypothetical protein